MVWHHVDGWMMEGKGIEGREEIGPSFFRSEVTEVCLMIMICRIC